MMLLFNTFNPSVLAEEEELTEEKSSEGIDKADDELSDDFEINEEDEGEEIENF